MIDFVKENFESHRPECWNAKIESLVKDGHITAEQAKIEKIAI